MRRRWIAVGALLATLAGLGVLAALTYRQSWLNDYRPVGPGEQLGIDVSHWQGEIDWPAVAGDGIRFAYIKATEGGDSVDERFAHNWVEARRAGIEVGAYHFFTLCRTGADQAANLLRTVPAGESDLPFAVDLEFSNNCAARPERAALHAELDVFLAAIERASGKRPVLYVVDDFDARYTIDERYDLPMWRRSLGWRPARSWAYWQLSDVGRVRGIHGDVDIDIRAAP